MRLLHKGLPGFCHENLLIMNIINFSSVTTGANVVLGFFDGVHRGHRALIDKARENGNPVGVWMFDSPPSSHRDSLLTTNDEKISLLHEYGADFIVTDSFDELKDFDGQSFTRRLIDALSPAAFVCGFNFRFGKDASCSADDLCRFSAEAGIECITVPPLMYGENAISSSAIRSMLRNGQPDKAEELLGRFYSVTSEVLHGNEIGRTIGYPTINQKLPASKLEPKHGVYACSVLLDGISYGGVCSLGSRPTVNADTADVTLETNIFGYSGNAYGKTVSVALVSYLRGEIRFSSVDELSVQIKKDSDDAARILSEKGITGE